MRSTDECEMSRSCHSATSSRPACRLPRSTRASPQSCSAFTGLRLCGIALEPFCAPARNGSSTSRDLGALQVADLEGERLDASRRPTRTRRAARRGGRGRSPGSPAPASRPSALAHVAPRPRGRRWSRCRPRPRACRPRSPRGPGAAARRSRRTCSAQSASLAPNVVGSAWMPWVRPTIGVSRYSWARAAIAASSVGRGVEQEVAAPASAAATSAVSTTSLDVSP